MVSDAVDLGRVNQVALEDVRGDEEGEVKSVVEEDADNDAVPRKDSQDDVLGIDEVDADKGDGEADELALEQARHGAKIRRGWTACLPLRFLRSSSLYSISTSRASSKRASLRRFV